MTVTDETEAGLTRRSLHRYAIPLAYETSGALHLPERRRRKAKTRRGVALAHKSRWPKLLAGHLNVNALNPGEKTDMAESSAVHGVEVTIARA